ncbi:hypothetical protein [Clostridium uliginosum]|uniref:Uncharacterized protein n=1 Tax=Clostridium uliginosum TaxID=119641 RepID=A0A1I1NN22_9CLOT|nr:hypothetical protein [Clostridium uliginosum]SFC99049.1 hypothetical protein SAMN05421842_1168 [Clostridium uliginosum]
MKKFAILSLFFICLSLNILKITPAAQTNSLNISKATSVVGTNVFKEGVYKVSDFNLSQNNLYNVQNVSSKSSIYMLIFDENQIGLQYLRLNPNSEKYNLVPLKPNYRIVILGEGEAFIS